MKTGIKNKKFTKWDYLNLGILTIAFIVLVCLIWPKGKLYGSTTDWSSQHIFFPEYFRTLFYETKNFFPDFAFHIGAGQNIYNFAYYGLLNPVVMLSYLLPMIPMSIYIIISSCGLVLISVLLFYRFLRNHRYSSFVSLVSSMIFMCATPLLFHSHRHIMFINYMPFLILGLMGIDLYFDKKKSWLLILSTFLMILMSYYYSVVGIIVFVIYGVYQYIKRNDHITFKSFMIDGIKFVFPILIGVLLSAVLIVPTFLVILSGRGATTVSITLKDIFMPNVYLEYILYKTYGIGLSAIALFSLVHLSFQKREYKYLAIVLFLPLVLPLFNYIFNATMYIDAKALIPFLPLYCLVIAYFINDIIDKKVKALPVILITVVLLFIGESTLGGLKYILYIDTIIFILVFFLYKKTNYKILMGVSLCLYAFLTTLFSSKQDHFVDKKLLFGHQYSAQQELINNITKEDQDMYRISNQIMPYENTNRLYENSRYLQTTLYSSTYNMGYNKFYYDVMNNPIQSRNRVITSSAKNYPFLLLTSNKYMLMNKKPFLGYEKMDELDGVEVYKNDNVLPLGYASSKVYALKDFLDLEYPYNQDIILKNIIVDKDVSSDEKSLVKEYDLVLDTKELEDLDIKKEGSTTIIDIHKDTRIKLPLETVLEDKLLYIHFDLLEANSCRVGDSVININDISNKLTCNPWKYHNQNYTFDYVLSTKTIEALDVYFSKGVYKIENLSFYLLDYETIKNINDDVDAFIFDKERTKGDVIEGDIKVSKDGYFTLSVPFDKGFKAFVDGKEVNVEKTNVAFIGFPIEKGDHHIKIEYKAPGKSIGVLLSLVGGILMFGLVIYERKRTEHERRNIEK